MEKFTVTGLLTISVFTKVEAPSAEQALKEAESRVPMSLCHYCARGESENREWVTSGELDGEPYDLCVEAE